MSMLTYDFSGKVVVVTGGATGIGRATAEMFRDAGATVHVWDLNAAAYAGVTSAIVDVTNANQIAAATAQASAAGGIDILINNAGYVGPNGSLVDYDPREWRKLIEVNLIGIYEVTRHVVPVMQRRKRGRIINMASIAGKEGTAFGSAYTAAKAGVIGLTKALAKEVVSDNIFVNAIAPGPIETELIKQVSPAHLQVMLSKCPMGRLATPEECARLIAWLASDAASFSTGAVFDLSGGRATY
jgi:2-dehydro-3-deoxy-L-rhamnonate dehydrogenase (NAD+)